MIKQLILSCCCCFFSGVTMAEQWSTWTPWEPDSVMAAWLVSRYHDQSIQFIAHEKGTQVAPLFSFDNPNSPLSRDGKETTFQKVAKHLGVDDDCIQSLSTVSYVIEMIPWQMSLYPDVVELKIKLQPHVPRNVGVAELDKAFSLLDQHCEKLRKERM